MEPREVAASSTASPTSAPWRRAVIDIGTNSVKLLVADCQGGMITPVEERSETTRLGRGFYEDHRIRPVAIRDTTDAVAHFVGAAARLGVAVPRILATSAVREAKNREELLTAIHTATALPVEVLSGEREADLAFHGVTSDPRYAGRPLLILDVGGGSTEFILGCDQSQSFRESFQLGVVRLMEQFDPADPPTANDLQHTRQWLLQFIHDHIRPLIEPALKQLEPRPMLVGTGGTSTILARMEQKMTDYDRPRIESCLLAREVVTHWTNRLWALSLAERKQIIGLPPQRADVITMGAAIFEAVMEGFGFDRLQPSTRGLRFAAVMEGYRKT